MPERVTASMRRFVAERARFRCEYCRTPVDFAPSPFSAEHIYPRVAGGSHAAENLALSCQGCNGHKAVKIGAIDTITRVMTPLFHPRRQKWEDHFVWTADGTEMAGKNSVGRATVVALRLNRPGLKNLRRLMVNSGVHPSE
jgi:HNH endonuclease